MQDKKQQVEPDMEQQIGSKLERSMSRLYIVTPELGYCNFHFATWHGVVSPFYNEEAEALGPTPGLRSLCHTQSLCSSVGTFLCTRFLHNPQLCAHNLGRRGFRCLQNWVLTACEVSLLTNPRLCWMESSMFPPQDGAFSLCSDDRPESV